MVIESGIPSSLMSAGQGRGDILRVCVYIYASFSGRSSRELIRCAIWIPVFSFLGS